MTCRVLVVEDEIFVALEMQSVLEDVGMMPVGIAGDRDKALALAPKADIAFVDLNLADGPTGAEVGKMLAERGIAVVYVTANPAQLGQGVPGTLGVLPKPLDDRELREAAAFAAAMRPQARMPPPPPPPRLKLFESPGSGALPA